MIRVIAAPVAEHISLEEAYLQLRIDPTDDCPPSHPEDSLIQLQIAAAREWCEQWMQRSVGSQTLEMALDSFPAAAVELPLSPVQEIVSVVYLDSDGAEQTLAPNLYALDNYQVPAWLLPAYGTTWPSTYAAANAIKVRYLAGYTFSSDSPDEWPLPASIKAAMLLVLGHLYENREQTSTLKPEDIPLGARSLLLPWRLRLSMA